MAEFKKLSNIEYHGMRIEKGESIVEELKKFMLKGKPGSVTFIVVAGGGFTEVKCAFSVGGYKTKERPDAPYINYDLKGPHEIAGTAGNIVWHPTKTDEPMVHLHATFGSDKSETGVAHLHEAKVMATAEIGLITSDDRITRKHDEKLNLGLLDLASSTKKSQNPSPNNPDTDKFWKIALPVGIIIAGLMAITTFFILRERKVEKFKRSK